ncbi:hypothetical protein LSCM1_06550 [Leishmania martiniquensis]|uniref:Uncharacterized protein n=1 Tax=Leishmania martiniquensis TaxID=1580590 RepID=A0A836KRF1_9TRYP|nr:hypothetical protein LSCM1_06550 [Leishmania martiniquensis]
MTELVLCDGSEGSLRSIEVACATGSNLSSPMSPKEGLLILAHVWDTPTTRANAVGASGLGNTPMSCANVVTETLRFIHTNKYLKDRVHYTMETACASTVWTRDNADGGAVADATAGPSSGAAASQAAHARARQAQKHASCWAGAGAARQRSDHRPVQKQAEAAVEVLGGSSTSTGSGAAPEGASAVGSIPENEKRAMAVVKYATARAEHRHVAALFLGVGQRQEGKVYALGAVARRILLELRSRYPLYYVKKDGVKWRPALTTTTVTASAPPVRFTIVVAVPAGPRCESAAVVETRCGNEEAAPQTTASSAAPPQVPKDVQAAVEATVRYVENRCVRPHHAPQVDQITFAVIATSSSLDGDSTGDADRIDDGGGVAADGKGDSARICPLEAFKRYLETLPVITSTSHPPATAAALPMLPVGSVDPAEPRKADEVEPQGPEHGDTVTFAGGNAKTEPTPRAAASPVTVCALKVSKKFPFVSLEATPEVALTQIVKQVGALKPEVLVMPISLVPEPLQLALLVMSTPHCVVLPL